jgi:hypothetical protein
MDQKWHLCGHCALRDLIDQVESQHLNPARYPLTGVGEAQAVYRIGRERSRETLILPRCRTVSVFEEA